ncbi:LysM peptidoglycan-binding domain-containing protein [Paraglaciecola sp. MB-3u-78]|uniref:LysM peptidoglycan-binding domain-containing protein n=1 Tax=Paraglaciecola sp. MB-3u-78 TaxID=2058332 RepID=UPI000C34D546|nr:LysM peptidoglycan-binding domain-containing protein [Paraglaciecola sp. MB-3u-78]PKG97522.1 lytic transglycosylase [Paraglaciecola sp. MB-3u-78]
MRSHTLLSLVLIGTLSACNATTQSDEQASQLEQEHQIAEQIVVSCGQSKKQAEDHFDCESAESGTIPITHPVEPIEVAVEVPEEIAVAAAEIEIKDVWQRVRSQLKFEFEDNKRIAAQRNWYLKHPSYMKRVALRAKPFLHLIVEKMEQQNMPLELVLLPIVESAFDPFAYSHGRAAGMWQFIPSTGQRFGMKQTWWYDGRRDVMASTQGAIDYLNYLVKMFDGNWLHALAAYNSGEGRVQRSIRKNKRMGKNTDFWNLDLPRETRAYVPKLLALADILNNSDQYSFEWPEINNIPLTQEVSIGSQIDLALGAEMAGLTVKELHALNPGYNRWATDPNGPYKLLLPIDKVEKFSTELAKTDSSQRLNWVRHKVKSGDSLLQLANKYHTNTDIISKVNELKSNLIIAGNYLIIPVALKSLDSYSLSQEQRLAKTQSKKSGAYKLNHTVKSGDTFWDISREYKVNLRQLAKWNGMAPADMLRPGKTLVVWVDNVSKGQSEDAVMRTLTYTVRNGDSLARIAGKFNVKISDLQKWNQAKLTKYLQPGQKLKIFVDVTRT